MPLVIVVIVVIVGGLIWRARKTRRLTIEESVDQYRRTLGAVQDAAVRSRASEGEPAGPPRDPRQRDPARFEALRFEQTRPTSTRSRVAPATRRTLVVAAMAIVTVVAVGVVIAAGHGKPPHRASTPTSTRPPATHPTTTTRPAPTTTVPLLAASGTSGTAFTVSKASYTIVVQTTNSACWIDLRNPTGTSLFSGTLAAGDSQSVTAGAVTLKLGNPAAVRVSVNGTPVPFSLASGSPVTLHFQGTA